MIVAERKTPWTLQELFTHAWNHAVVEKNPPCTTGISPITTTTCFYRSVDHKNACLIGAAIPEELYQEQLEALTADQFCDHPQFMAVRLFKKIDSETLAELQKCHDDAATQCKLGNKSNISPFELEMYLRKVTQFLHTFAKEHGLKVPA